MLPVAIYWPATAPAESPRPRGLGGGGGEKAMAAVGLAIKMGCTGFMDLAYKFTSKQWQVRQRFLIDILW